MTRSLLTDRGLLTRPVLRYHGGKWMLAPWIIEHFPPHRIYTEAYGGAASVLMRKPRAKLVEVYNDLDGEIVSLFRLLRDPDSAGALARLLESTPFAREEFALSYQPDADPLEQARRTVVRSFMGFGSDSASGTKTGFRANGNQQSAHPAKDWGNYPAAVAAFCDRLRGVVIENRPALEVLLQHDGAETLHYCDPTYLPDTRRACMIREGKGYRHEMTEDDHKRLAEVLHDGCGYGGAVRIPVRAVRRTLRRLDDRRAQGLGRWRQRAPGGPLDQPGLRRRAGGLARAAKADRMTATCTDGVAKELKRVMCASGRKAGQTLPVGWQPGKTGNYSYRDHKGENMKLWAIQAYGNYGGGCAFVRAATKERALELASKIVDRSWQTRYDKPGEIVELPDAGEGVLYHFETGE